ncbi:D-alanyl-D-alanine carboxypeptidase/D-alanyl-D-alanine endopeptidase [Rothia uropygioeca]|uniref:D-alanyl-D-alanine carboxypeptidase/D-alanyl-D-alanine endopeptidase n=1 Tax=Kocuria sp. 257 TaxID=2021970 RepID=UPI001010E817|nr:D-alanyl-D-alanine carboxypeptidase/D-alanyl-D-alanine-endopeptidase [Kocuria sp. 257]
MRKRQPQRSEQHTSRGWWIASGIVAVGCIGIGAWLVPTAAGQWDSLTGADQPDALASASSVDNPVKDLPGDADQPAPADLAGPLEAASGKLDGGGTMASQVVDVASGNVLYSDDATRPVTPASNLKLLTQFALLSHADPNSRYETNSYLSEDSKSVTLVAGGDTMLSSGTSDENSVLGHAGVQTLAAQTIQELKDKGVSGKLPVNLDASMYSGQGTNPAWDSADVDAGYVTSISPIALWDHHTQRPSDGEDVSHRPQNAGADALNGYVKALNEAGASQGLSFTSGSDSSEAAEHADSQRLGSVESATVLEQAKYMMENSDNVLAEVLGRNAAIAAGNEGSIEGAIKTVKQTLTGAGISTDGLIQKDSCGLSADNRVTPITLAQIIAHATQSETATSNLAETLPVAGGTGTLASRFEADDASAAQGSARAKTGTLLKVNSLTGYTTTSQGRLLAYSFVVNDVTNSEAATTALDASVAALTKL